MPPPRACQPVPATSFTRTRAKSARPYSICPRHVIDAQREPWILELTASYDVASTICQAHFHRVLDTLFERSFLELRGILSSYDVASKTARPCRRPRAPTRPATPRRRRSRRSAPRPGSETAAPGAAPVVARRSERGMAREGRVSDWNNLCGHISTVVTSPILVAPAPAATYELSTRRSPYAIGQMVRTDIFVERRPLGRALAVPPVDGTPI